MITNLDLAVFLNNTDFHAHHIPEKLRMSLIDALAILGVPSLVLTVLTLLNEHDRRIWLAPWRPWWSSCLLIGYGFVLAYFLTADTWAQKGWVSKSLILWNSNTINLSHEQWAVIVFLFGLFIAALWTWLAPQRFQESMQILEERRIASDYTYLSGKTRSLLASSGYFRRHLRKETPRFLLDRGLLLHWLENDLDLLLKFIHQMQTRSRLSKLIDAVRNRVQSRRPKRTKVSHGIEFGETVMTALAAERTSTLNDALRYLYEDDALQRPQSSLFRALGPWGAEGLWERFYTHISARTAGRGTWGSGTPIRDATDPDILNTYAGRLCLSSIWLVRCTALSSSFRDSCLEGHAGTVIRQVLQDLDGVASINTPQMDYASKLLDRMPANAMTDRLALGVVIDPLRKTPGAKLRTAQVVTMWFLDEWIQRIRRSAPGSDRQLTLGSLFQFFRHILDAEGLDRLERQALITSAVDDLCAMTFSDDENAKDSEEERPCHDVLMNDLEDFNDDLLSSDIREVLAPWFHSRYYWGYGRTGNECYWRRLKCLQQRYPIPGETLP